MIVVDASVVIEVLLGTAAGRAIEDRLFDSRASLHAPHLVDVETAHVLRRYEATGDLTSGRAVEAIEDLRDLPITRHEHALLLPRIWQLRRNLTAYDAAYVALADALDATLLTRDAKLARAAGRQLDLRDPGLEALAPRHGRAEPRLALRRKPGVVLFIGLQALEDAPPTRIGSRRANAPIYFAAGTSP